MTTPETPVSRQRLLEQERTAAAWQCIARHKEQASYRKEYGSLARSAPADIQMSGLGQTLAFWRAKGMKGGQPKDQGLNAHYQLLTDLSNWVGQRLGIEHQQGLLGWIMAEQTTTNDYRRATAEAIAFLIWLKRFAEAELGD